MATATTHRRDEPWHALWPAEPAPAQVAREPYCASELARNAIWHFPGMFFSKNIIFIGWALSAVLVGQVLAHLAHYGLLKGDRPTCASTLYTQTEAAAAAAAAAAPPPSVSTAEAVKAREQWITALRSLEDNYTPKTKHPKQGPSKEEKQLQARKRSNPRPLKRTIEEEEETDARLEKAPVGTADEEPDRIARRRRPRRRPCPARRCTCRSPRPS